MGTIVTPNQQVLLLASALVLASAAGASASTVTETTTSEISVPESGTAIFSFPTLMGADELVSVSGGSAFFPEGGTLTVSVEYTNSTEQQIFSATFDGFDNLDLTSIANAAFPAGDIDGVKFDFEGDQGNLDIPAGTQFVFDVAATAAPEPASWTLLVAGFAGLGFAARSRRKKALQA
jgi:PEP-CTERM motif